MPVVRPRVPKPRQNSSTTGVAAFGALVGCAFFSIPFVAHFTKKENLNSQEKPLTVSAVRRGAYQNSGSRDVGVDTDWDFATNSWNGRKGADVLRAKQHKHATTDTAANDAHPQ